MLIVAAVIALQVPLAALAPVDERASAAAPPAHLGLDIDVDDDTDRLVLRPRRGLVDTGPRLALVDAAPAAAPSDAAPARVRARGIAEETRVFWYTAGASALTSLGVRVIAFVPGLLATIAIGAMAVPFGPAAPMVLFVALGVGFAAIDAAIASIAGALVFDRASNFYSSRYVAAFGGQFLGNALAVGVSATVLGYGMMLLTGVTSLTEFIGEGVGIGFAFFSFFGLLPAVVLGFFAGVALPAMIGAWALAATAEPREGFVIDPTWDPFAERAQVAPPRPREREVALLPVALPLGLVVPRRLF